MHRIDLYKACMQKKNFKNNLRKPIFKFFFILRTSSVFHAFFNQNVVFEPKNSPQIFQNALLFSTIFSKL